MASNLTTQIFSGAKWSSFAEILSRLVQPISVVVLARLLTPDAFGVLATVTMVISFADMFTDAGFQKFLIQHEFKTQKELFESTTVAFWTNLAIAFLLYAMIFLFREELASLVGNAGLGHVLATAALSLPFTAFSSIQMALYRRTFNFKTLFKVRLISVFVPFVVTIPVAYIYHNYWSLVCGMLAGHCVNAIMLTYFSLWKPNFYYSIHLLKNMLSYSIWTLIESISIWLTGYLDIFIVGSVLNAYYLGIYKISMTTVGQIMGLIIGSIMPVVFSALSRLQNDNDSFKNLFFQIQKYLALFLFPLGIGIYQYRQLITEILLGNQWNEATGFIGIWSLMSALTIVLGHLASEVYRSKGKPKLSFFAQMLHLVFLAFILFFVSDSNFITIYEARSLSRFQLIFVHLCILSFYFKISPFTTTKVIFPAIVCSSLMWSFSYTLKSYNAGMLWDFFSIFLCILFYCGMILLFPSIRKDCMYFVRKKFI